MTDWSVRNVRDLTWEKNGLGVYCDLVQGDDDAAEHHDARAAYAKFGPGVAVPFSEELVA